MNSPEALIPGCVACRMSDGLPHDCACSDWISEHTYPCGFAIRSLELTIARLLYGREKWNESVLIEEANKALLAEGYSVKGVAKQWVIDRGIYYVLQKYKVLCTVSSGGYNLLRYTVEGKESSCSLVYFRIDLPTKGKFTMWPVTFPSKNFNQQGGWRNFFDEKLDREKYIIGEDETWKNEWEEFWRTNEISYGVWTEAVNRYWEAVGSGKEEDLETIAILDKVQTQLTQMLQSRFLQWRE